MGLAPRQRHKTVLVVEDDAPTRELYRHALAQYGFTVIAVEDGLAALRSIEIGRPDVVVLDLNLPRLSGVDVYAELRAHPTTRTLPVVIVTGEDVREEASQFRFFLRKPVGPEALAEAVDRAIRLGAGRSSPVASELG